MSSSAQKRLPLVLFRAILRWSNKAEGVPFQLRHTDILKCTGPAVFTSLDSIENHNNNADVIRDIARQTFKFKKGLQVFLFMRMLNVPPRQVHCHLCIITSLHGDGDSVVQLISVSYLFALRACLNRA